MVYILTFADGYVTKTCPILGLLQVCKQFDTVNRHCGVCFPDVPVNIGSLKGKIIIIFIIITKFVGRNH